MEVQKLERLIDLEIVYCLLTSLAGKWKVKMGFYHAVAILAIDNSFRTPSLELKYMGTSFCGIKQKVSIPRDSTWLLCD